MAGCWFYRFALFEAGIQVICTILAPREAAPHVGLTMFALFEGIQRQFLYFLLPLSESIFQSGSSNKFFLPLTEELKMAAAPTDIPVTPQRRDIVVTLCQFVKTCHCFS